MTDYRIVCVQKAHGEIIGVGVGTEPKHADRRWTVAEVRIALNKGDRFHAFSPTTGEKAYVDVFDTSGHPKNVNFNTLPLCDWKKS